MHGLGADGKDMQAVAEQLPLRFPVRHVFIDAPVRPVTLNNHMSMRAWYDIVGLKVTDRDDRAGILQSETLIRRVIDAQCADGFSSNQIFLAGFSQGAAMALVTALRGSLPLAGVVALSGYLPLASECVPLQPVNTPFWIAAGSFDPVVQPTWSRHTVDWLRTQGFQHVLWQEYPMQHSICLQEMNELAAWLSAIIKSIKPCNGVCE
jgi:phospholipase/carboxylesterase